MTCTTSGLQILVTLSRRYVMTSVMVSHIQVNLAMSNLLCNDIRNGFSYTM